MTRQVHASAALPGLESAAALTGYEIHMGQTAVLDSGSCRMQECLTASGDGRVWGSYVHGLFDSDGMRDALLAWACGAMPGVRTGFSYRSFKERQYDLLADTVEKHVDVERILSRLGTG